MAVAEAVYLDSADAVPNLQLLAVWPCGKDDSGVFAACNKGLARGRLASVKVPSSTAGVLAYCDVVDVDGAGLDFDEHLALCRGRRGWNLPKGERVRDGANGTPLVQVCGLHHAVRWREINNVFPPLLSFFFLAPPLHHYAADILMTKRRKLVCTWADH